MTRIEFDELNFCNGAGFLEPKGADKMGEPEYVGYFKDDQGKIKKIRLWLEKKWAFVGVTN